MVNKKAESTKRDYLTKKGIERHIHKLDYPGDPKERIKYLQAVIKKSRLISDNTKKEVYRELGKAYSDLAENKMVTGSFYGAHYDEEGPIEQMASLPNPITHEVTYFPWRRRKVSEERIEFHGEKYRAFLEKAAEAYETGGYLDMAKKIRDNIENDLKQEEREKKSRKSMGLDWWLGKATATASIVGVIGGLFFLSSNITGNAIADLTTKTTSFLGAGLLIVGLAAGWFWLKGGEV